MRSGSWGGAVRSTISIAGEMPAIAALAVSPSASAGTSRPICTAISGSSTGSASQRTIRFLRIARALLRQETHQRRGDVEKLQHRRRAETHLPAQWLVADIKTLAPRRGCACMPGPRRVDPPRVSWSLPLGGRHHGRLRRLMRLGIHFVAGRLDGARAHPAPHQYDVFVRGVVEAVPARARRIDDVAFARGCSPFSV